MPELPDIEVYRDALTRHAVGRVLAGIRIASPFVLRSVAPPTAKTHGRRLESVSRMGKRIVLGLSGHLYVVMHLMIAGRLRWRGTRAALPGRRGLAAFDFEHGTLLFTEEGTQKRAGLWIVAGSAALRGHDPGGIEPLACAFDAFTAALTAERHTLKRTLTDPHVFSGIGNAYSDEILHAAGLSPLQLTTNLSADDLRRLYEATRLVLTSWTDRLRAECGDGFPEKVTAFRDGMAVHGRYRKPCPVCGAPVQRIRYAANEVNYCATCQTGGRVLADRGLSRLLREDWPRSLDEWEERMAGRDLETGRRQKGEEQAGDR